MSPVQHDRQRDTPIRSHMKVRAESIDRATKEFDTRIQLFDFEFKQFELYISRSKKNSQCYKL